MDNKILFRTAISGFKKEDVVSYIEKISKDTNRLISEKDAKIKSLSERADELEKECAEKLDAAQKETDELKSKISALEDELTEKAEHESVDERQILSDEQNAELTKRCEALEKENADLKKQLDVYREFDGVQRDLGTIIIKAEKNAAEITAKAKTDADKMINDAKTTSRQITERGIKVCREISETFDRSKSGMDEAHGVLCEKLDDIKNALEAFYGSLELCAKVVHENVNEISDIR